MITSLQTLSPSFSGLFKRMLLTTLDREKFLHTSLPCVCCFRSHSSLRFGVFGVSGSEAVGRNHRRLLLARALSAIIEGCLRWLCPSHPDLLLHKSSFLPKVKELPDESCGDYLVTGESLVVVGAGACAGWVRRCWGAGSSPGRCIRPV